MGFTLIANSGVQFFRSEFSFNPSQELIKPIGFYEYFDNITNTISLQFATFIPEEDIWVPKNILNLQGFIDEDGTLDSNINYKLIAPFAIDEDHGFFTINNIEDCLSFFNSEAKEALWIPVPYFKKGSNNKHLFGPLAWARMMLKQIPVQNNDKSIKYHLVLAFDTKITEESEIYFTPRKRDTNETENLFSLSSNDDLNLNFCDKEFNCSWVDKSIKMIVQKGKDSKNPPHLKYLAYYLYLIKYLDALKITPEVLFYSDTNTSIDVDLVLDIGNANTCGILFESPVSNKPFEFTSVKKLELINLSEPEKVYNDPFSMRLTFVEPNFGDMNIPQHKAFFWPSIVRVGEEAELLINRHNLNIGRGKETTSNMSSPKRYLWDNDKSDIQWEFINYKGSDLKDAIYYEGISEQFKEDGSYAFDGDFSCTPYYSKKSLMTFVYMEIILHAITQINSHEFRLSHGNLIRPRKLKRITITCPTSIIQYEQIALRDLALDAVRALKRFFSNSFLGAYDINEDKKDVSIEVIPSTKEISKSLSQIRSKKDWIYDEATCGQFVFLYAEIYKRYLNNVEKYFDLFGKKRNDSINPDKKSITIATVDIGGGTTDLMISSYQYENAYGQTILTPNPLFWESFNLAGDDLLKEIIQQIIIEGTPRSNDEIGCTGVIENAANSAGVLNVPYKLINFFGSDSNNQGYVHRSFRKNFVNQVAIPIAKFYMKHASSELDDVEVGFEDIFFKELPNPEIINYFNQHFAPLEFEKIRWKLSTKKVSQIIELTYDNMLKQMSSLSAGFGCDFLLLTGKPSSFKKVRDLFIKNLPVSTDRIISLNKYRVGRWYPFADDIGYFSDTKTIVSVGALIALMSERLEKLSGFRLKLDHLKEKLISTSDYIGVMNRYTQEIKNIFLSPDENTYELEVHTLPVVLGYKQIKNEKYIGRPIYKIDISLNDLKRKIISNQQGEFNVNQINNQIESAQYNLKNKMPFRILLKRNFNESKETINIERITDLDNNDISRNSLYCKPMTLKEEYNYWLDTGEFNLNIR